MIEGWFWYLTSCFGRDFLKKIVKIFLGTCRSIFFLRFLNLFKKQFFFPIPIYHMHKCIILHRISLTHSYPMPTIFPSPIPSHQSRGAGMFEEARQRAEKHVIDESNRRPEARRPISPTVEKMLTEVNEPKDSKQTILHDHRMKLRLAKAGQG